MSTTPDSSTSFPFLSLPPEIRNHIYDLTLPSFPQKHIYIIQSAANLAQPALTRVNKQLRAETLSYYYSCNHFQIYTSGSLYAVHWLKSIGSCNRKCIRRLTICSWVGTRYVLDELKNHGVEVVCPCHRELDNGRACITITGMA